MPKCHFRAQLGCSASTPELSAPVEQLCGAEPCLMMGDCNMPGVSSWPRGLLARSDLAKPALWQHGGFANNLVAASSNSDLGKRGGANNLCGMKAYSAPSSHED